jgi:anti-anti-sigma factor
VGEVPEQPFELAEREEGGRAVLALSGELDLATVLQVQERLAALREQGRAALLDIDGLTFMDSSGIKLLVALGRDAQEGWDVRVTRGSETVQRVLRIAGVDEGLPYS